MKYPRHCDLVPALSLILMVARIPAAPQAHKDTAPAAESQIQARVAAIRQDSRAIDRSVDTPRESGLTQSDKQLPKWELSGAFDKTAPVFLMARYHEDNMVRQESYYFRNSRMILARVEKWWDVDNPDAAPEPATRSEFYLEDGRLLRQVTRISSKPPITRLGDTSRSPDWLIRRADTIAKILAGTSPGETIVSLNDLPELTQP